MIPKVFHYLWFGSYPDSQPFKDEWLTLCPEFTLIQWTNNNPDLKNYINEAILLLGYNTLHNKSITYVSDLVRLLILRDYGGVYLDHDIKILKNFNTLLCGDGVFTFQYDPIFKGMELIFKDCKTIEDIINIGYKNFRYHGDTVNNCFMAITKNHIIINDSIDIFIKNHSAENNFMMSDWGCGPAIITKALNNFGFNTDYSKTIEKDDITIFEKNVFHPIHGYERALLGIDEYNRKKLKIMNNDFSYTIHVHEHFGANMFLEKTLILFTQWYESFYGEYDGI